MEIDHVIKRNINTSRLDLLSIHTLHYRKQYFFREFGMNAKALHLAFHHSGLLNCAHPIDFDTNSNKTRYVFVIIAS